MGLDMYLSARKYIPSYTDDGKFKRDVINNLFGLPLNVNADYDDYSGVSEVVIEVAYWRKANAIHQWFVTNVQGCKDDCREYLVDRKQLVTLRELCNNVLSNKEKAEELLPTASGFFFGGTEYDKHYYSDLESTVKRLNKIMSDPLLEDAVFYYHSSW